MKAAYVAAITGSVSRASIRFAGQPKETIVPGPFEIVSLTGTLSDSRVHVHASFADSMGRVVGGHLMPGSAVGVTAEVVVVEAADLVFEGTSGPMQGFPYLNVRQRGAEDPR